MGEVCSPCKNGDPIMCGCRRRRPNRAVPQKALKLAKPDELALVMSSMPEPVYGCVTGTRYPFNEQSTLYMDIRDTDCLPVEYIIV